MKRRVAFTRAIRAARDLPIPVRYAALELACRADDDARGTTTTRELADAVGVTERSAERWLEILADGGWFFRGGRRDWRLQVPRARIPDADVGLEPDTPVGLEPDTAVGTRVSDPDTAVGTSVSRASDPDQDSSTFSSTSKTADVDPTGGRVWTAAAAKPGFGNPVSEIRISCPASLRLSDDQLALLEQANGCDRASALKLCAHFAGKWQNDEPRPLSAWLKAQWTAVVTAWQNPTERRRLLPPPGLEEHEARRGSPVPDSPDELARARREAWSEEDRRAHLMRIAEAKGGLALKLAERGDWDELERRLRPQRRPESTSTAGAGPPEAARERKAETG